MRYPSVFTLSGLLTLSCFSHSADAAISQIVLTPTNVGSAFTNTFSTLPTVDPTLFGLTGDVRAVTFDEYPAGTTLTNQYAALGVTMNSIYISNSVFGGPASAPNATFFDQGHIFTFTVPVIAAGIINTSPDNDTVEFWSGPNRTGSLLLSFQDTYPDPVNFYIDRFVGAVATQPTLIGSIWVGNNSGNLELDELIFQVVPEPASVGLLAIGGLTLIRRRSAAR